MSQACTLSVITRDFTLRLEPEHLRLLIQVELLHASEQYELGQELRDIKLWHSLAF